MGNVNGNPAATGGSPRDVRLAMAIFPLPLRSAAGIIDLSQRLRSLNVLATISIWHKKSCLKLLPQPTRCASEMQE